MSKFFFFLFFFVFVAAAISSLNTPKAPEPITEEECATSPDGSVHCCFLAMPQTLTNRMEIADSTETGRRIVISGVVYKADGKTPYPKVIIYAYHTDNTGHYSKRGDETGIQKWHGHLHGWCRTNDKGEYEIHTIQPAPYPSGGIPAHIHAVVREPNEKDPYYINDYVFSDDPLVDAKYIADQPEVGGSGVVTLTEQNGVWVGIRNLIVTN